MWFIWFGAVTINGTEAEDQAIWQGYQNTDKQEAFRFLIPNLRGSGRGFPLLRASNEHCFIVRVPGAKGCSGCETVPC
jgi:hypothetical protein